jgi:hypothetical protein
VAPTLLSLQVTSPADEALTLVPDFCPSVFDYYVQCAGNRGDPTENALVVSVEPAAGSRVTLAIETPGGGLTPATPDGGSLEAVKLAVDNDQAIVVTATAPPGTGAAPSQQYWVRCLSDDFPEMEWATHDAGSARTPGYYLFGTMSLPRGPRGNLAEEAAYAVVLDTNGVPVWYKYDNDFAAYDVESLAPGDISFSGPWEVDHLGGAVIHPVADGIDGGGPLTPDEHELRYVAATGHYFGFNSATGPANLTGLSLPDADGGVVDYGPNSTIYGCYVQEFDVTGHLYWQWSAAAHFDPVKAMVVKGDGDMAVAKVDPFHCNSIDVDPANGNILVSARNMASLIYIDHATGKVLWMMGAAPRDSCFDAPAHVAVDDPFTAQHDARLLPGWAETCGGGHGQISVFDDATYTTRPARGVVYDVNIAGGCAGGPSTGGSTSATRVWQYQNTYDGGVASNVCGGFRVSPDGSRIIGWGQSVPTPNGLVFTEVDPQGNDLVDLICPDKSSSYRAVKVPLDAFDVGLLRSTAGE